MILTIDCGNTRLKWALYAEAAPPAIVQGSVLLGALDDLDAVWRTLPQPQSIAIANVAGGAVRATLSRLLLRWPVEPLWAVAAAKACGVTSRYEQPAQLGVDRWAALIAAWGRCRAACLVVSAGTATTIDALSATGEFTGGRILAGVDLMKNALAAHTAGLPLALTSGHYQLDPRNTADAIASGCLDAQAGAIERCHARLPAGASCLISGGAAAAIAARLTIRATVVDNLSLEGLLRIAQEAGAAALADNKR